MNWAKIWIISIIRKIMWGGVYIFKTAQIIVKFLLDLMKFLKFLNKKWLYIMLEDHKKLFKKQLKKIFSK